MATWVCGSFATQHSDQMDLKRGHKSGRQVTLILYSDTTHIWRLYARLCIWNVIEASKINYGKGRKIGEHIGLC